MNLSALIIDDEADSRSVLSKLLSQFCPQVHLCGEAATVSAAYQLILERTPQVVFLDIQMPGGDGFSLLRKFEEIPFEVIFVTSYDKYAIEAIRFSALDYLVKPVEVSDLCEAVSRLEKIIACNSLRQQQMQNMLSLIENRKQEKRIAVHHNDQVKLLPVSEITHFEGERNYTQIFTGAGEKYTSSRNLGEFEDMLKDYPIFLRISKSCIANLNFVSNYTKGDPCMLTLCNNYTFEISRRKKKELLERLMNK